MDTTNTATLFHGTWETDDEWTTNLGLCLTDDLDIAESYGESVHTMIISLDDMVVCHINNDVSVCWDSNDWPCDNDDDLSAMAAEGVDLITYSDGTETGAEHMTFRIISQRALDALVAI